MSGLWTWFWELLPGNALARRIVAGASRRSTHLWIRTAYLFGLILLMSLMLAFAGGLGEGAGLSDLAKNGSWVFVVIAYVQVGLICLLAPLFMAGAIQQEQSGKTLDILLSTPMSNLQIVLGSLLGRIFFVLALLFSGLPLFSVLMLFGGVPIASVFTAFAVAALTAIFVGSVAVALAVTRVGGRRAVMVFIVGIAAYLLVGIAADQVVRWSRTSLQAAPVVAGATGAPTSESLSARAGLTTWITPLHPILVLESTIHTANYRPPSQSEVAHLHPVAGFYLSRPGTTYAILTMVLSLSMLLVASTQLRRVNQDEGITTRELGGWIARILGRGPRKARTVWSNPIAWKECHGRRAFGAGLLLRYGLGLGSALLTGALIWSYHHDALPALRAADGRLLEPPEVLLSGIRVLLQIQFILIILVTIYIGAGSISREREDGTLDLLLATPITPGQFIWGKLRGLLSYVGMMSLAPIVCLGMVLAYSLVAWHWDWPQGRWTVTVVVQSIYDVGQQVTVVRPLIVPEAVVFFPVVLLAFLGMCAAVAMNWSIKAKGVFHAVVPSVGVIAAVMTVTGICGLTSAERIPIIGAAFNAFSPFTLITVMLDPHQTAAGYVTTAGGISFVARFVLALGPLLAGLAYCVVIYVGVDTLIRNFDLTVRRFGGDS
ncbi:MAG: hypothetical protein JJU36_12650 [Phycisphaeraceae bacterium]|nr:hypothetical protein [Phycisphaeraceae bacterium]